MSDEILNDEMPIAPQGAVGSTTTQTGSDAEVSAELFDAVPAMGEPLPKATYHFRLDRYIDGIGEPNEQTPADERIFGGQPYFQVFWSCQEEPYVGRTFLDFVPWCNAKTFAAAADRSNPLQATAQKLVNNRIWKAKAIAEAAGMKPSGSFSLKNFLGTNPEVKITVGLQERKQKDASGKYVGTGQQGNKANAYLPLFRPV